MFLFTKNKKINNKFNIVKHDLNIQGYCIMAYRYH